MLDVHLVVYLAPGTGRVAVASASTPAGERGDAGDAPLIVVRTGILFPAAMSLSWRGAPPWPGGRLNGWRGVGPWRAGRSDPDHHSTREVLSHPIARSTR